MARPKIRFKFCKYGHDLDIVGKDTENRCDECGRIRHRAYRERNKVKILNQEKNHKRFKRYGITPQNYDDMLRKQQGRCAICNCIPKEDSQRRTFHIDHCHSTGRIRGLLCKDCNLMLGFAKDKSDILLRAIEYLK